MYFTPAETWWVCVVLFIARLSLRCALLSLASQSYPLSAPSPLPFSFHTSPTFLRLSCR